MTQEQKIQFGKDYDAAISAVNEIDYSGFDKAKARREYSKNLRKALKEVRKKYGLK